MHIRGNRCRKLAEIARSVGSESTDAMILDAETARNTCRTKFPTVQDRLFGCIVRNIAGTDPKQTLTFGKRNSNIELLAEAVRMLKPRALTQTL